MPLTLCSGMIEGAETWESYKALRRAMKTGRAEDARAVGAAIVKEMDDPKKAEAFTKGTKQAEIGMRAADILRRDQGELSQMMKDAGSAYRMAKEAQKKHGEATAAWNTEHSRHMEAVGRLCEGEDAGALAVIGETARAIVRYRKDAEKYAQEYVQKKGEADSLYKQAMTVAAAKAKREMMEDAERQRNRRKNRSTVRSEREEQEGRPKNSEEQMRESTNMKSENESTGAMNRDGAGSRFFDETGKESDEKANSPSRFFDYR